MRWWVPGLVLGFVLSVTAGPHAIAQESTSDSKKESAAQPLSAQDGVIRSGAALGDSPEVKLTDVIKDSKEFIGKTVIIEGSIAEVCQKKGCWMKVLPEEGESGVRVTFKDYGFFVPMDSMGMRAKMEGEFHLKTWSKEDADHLEGEGAQLVRNTDGTADELGFIATGVELRKVEKAKVAPKSTGY